MTLPLSEKYRANCFLEIKGQDLAITEITNFYKKFPMKRALILNGPVGVGKTCLAIALAKEFNLELFELNASDLKNRKKLEKSLKGHDAIIHLAHGRIYGARMNFRRDLNFLGAKHLIQQAKYHEIKNIIYLL